MQSDIKRTNVLGVGVSSINMDAAVEILLDARIHGRSGYVCVTGVHGVIESQRDPELKMIHNRSFLTVPDGMPTVWMGREQGFVHMGRVYGPDLMARICEETAVGSKVPGTENEAIGKEPVNSQVLKADSSFYYPSQDETGTLDIGVGQRTEHGSPSTINHQPSTDKKCFTHFLYGSTPAVLDKLKSNFESRFPGIRIVGTFSPPFRPLNEIEEMELQRMVAECKPDFFWVGLSTPKQERFMAAHCADMNTEDRGQRTEDGRQGMEDSSLSTINYQPSTDSGGKRYPLDAGIMLGVGAAFDIHAGLLKDAPEWIKNSGLQWFYRLCQEPRRLWRRYLDIVPKFLGLAFFQLLGIKKYSLE